jgi:amidase
MPIDRPSSQQIEKIAGDLGMKLSAEELESYRQLLSDSFASYDRIDELTEPKLVNGYSRPKGERAAASENPYNAWYWKSTVNGADSGPLNGKKIALKDNICLAGVPMMNGAQVLEGYVPDIDATVATRMLDAGGTILGKATSENLCLSGGSFTSAPHAVTNPHKTSHQAGGSSSGSAVLVSIGEVDMALGGDQGGSIRIPASWTGVYGLKPTHGLVPYTGVFPIELTLDHCGPICSSVADVALLLSVIAGADGHDPRQGNAKTQDYLGALDGGVSGLKIGIVTEGFERPESEPEVDASVRAAAERYTELGADVGTVSLPEHLDGPHLWNAIGFEGVTVMMMHGGSQGTNWNGHYLTSLADYYGRNWRAKVDELSTSTKFVLLAGEFMQREHPGVYYAKAQNLGNVMRAAYDAALSEYDLLLMPTTPMRAQPMVSTDLLPVDYLAKAFEMIGNTCPTDITHHPALNVPCAMVDGLPVGMMLIGRHYDEATVLRAAAAFEASGDWKTF